jgi:hypothetical protein
MIRIKDPKLSLPFYMDVSYPHVGVQAHLLSTASPDPRHGPAFWWEGS